MLSAGLVQVSTLHAEPAQGSVIEDELTVTATRVPLPPERVGSTLQVIDRATIEARQQLFVGDLLRAVPGTNLSRSGGVGGVTAARLRGSESRHTLVLVDGVPVNNVANGASADLSYLLTSDVARVEVLSGPQSVLYGSDALGGVINVVTREQGSDLSVEGGSFGTGRLAANTTLGDANGWQLRLGGDAYHTDGTSSAAERNGNTEADGYRQRSFRLNLRRQWDAFAVNLSSQGDNVRTEYDDDYSSGRLGDSDAESFSQHRRHRLLLQHGLHSAWQGELSLARNEDRLKTFDSFPRRQHSYRDQAGYQAIIDLADHQQLVTGAEYRHEVIDQGDQPSLDTGALFAQWLGHWQATDLTLGARLDDHETFGSEPSYRATAVHRLGASTRLRGSVGTAFKAPAIGDLLGAFGNPDLQPETSTAWDLGVEQDWALAEGSLTVGATWFEQRIDDLIRYPAPSYVPVNVGELDSRGLELRAEATWQHWTLAASYNHQDAEQRANSAAAWEPAIRRPEQAASVDVTWRPSDRWTTHLGIHYTGEQTDTDFNQFPAADVTLDAFTRVDLAVRYRSRGFGEWFARAENLTDADCQEVLDYGSRGRGFYAGVTLRF